MSGVYLSVLLLFVVSSAGAEPASVPLASPEYGELDYEYFTLVHYCESNCLTTHEALAVSKLLSAFSPNGAQMIFFVSPSSCKAHNVNMDRVNFRCDCDIYENCHLTEINLGSSQLNGVLDEALCTFRYLQKIDLRDNYLSGIVPRCLGNLRMLQEIYLDGNQLNGTIPESLQNLTSLEILSLRGNLFEGKIPRGLGDLTNLLELYGWSLCLRDYYPMDRLYCFNDFSYGIKAFFFFVFLLTNRSLDENLLNGTLNPALGKLRKLRLLSLSGNNFTGKLPDSYKRLTNLLTFSVGGNNLSGPIPEYITQWKQLIFLEITGNNFESLPRGFFNLSSLETLKASDLGGSGFSIPFPPHATLPQLKHLELRNCSINGEIPPEIINLSNLSYLDLSFNSLTGGIPNSMKEMYSLEELHLEGNHLGGPFPHWVYNRPGNLLVDLSYNDFSVSESKSWNYVISNRNFVQRMSTEFCGLKKHKHRSLFIDCGGDGTNFEGRIYDADESNSKFFVSKNKNWAYTCSGTQSSGTRNETCVALYSKARLCTHSLTYYGFCLQKRNYDVTLHFYENVPMKENYRSRVFDIYIQGRLVERDFNIRGRAKSPTQRKIDYNTTANVTDDNLLVIRLYWAGKGSSLLTNGYGPLISGITMKEFENKGLSRESILVVISCTTTVLVILLAVILLVNMIYKYKDSKAYAARKVELAGGRYSIKQLVEATENFSLNCMIGKGRFGEVYKAKLSEQDKSKNIEVAVKKVSLESKKMEEEIKQDVLVPTKWEHENLLKCLGGGSHKNIHLLIYEYMENGSLKSTFTGFNSNLQLLDWRKRFKICHGIADGLKHLHERSENIVHRDIKPSSILLDRDFNPKISDFRLAKVYNEDEENPLNFIDKLKLPYAAPEFKKANNAITTKVDVYSYGVIVLEIISGKEADPPERAENPEIPYLYDVANVLKRRGRLAELIDQSLPINAEEKKKAIIILELAMMCVDATPTLRPNMSDVVAVLEGTKTIEQISESTLTVTDVHVQRTSPSSFEISSV